MEKKFEIESTLYTLGYIFICSADIFKIEWLSYAGFAACAAAITVMIAIINSYRRIPANVTERRQFKKKIIYKSVFLILLTVLCVLFYFTF